MKITIDDLFEAMRGTARPRVIAAVLAEFERDGSPLRGWLEGMGSWAKARLPSVERRKPRPLLPEGSKEENSYPALKVGATRNGRREKVVVPPIVDDYLAYREGTASRAVVSRVTAALADPESELSQVLKGVSKKAAVIAPIAGNDA